MNVSEISIQNINSSNQPSMKPETANKLTEKMPFNQEKTVFELGIRLRGLQSFGQSRFHDFLIGNQTKPIDKNWSSEIRLTNSTLLYSTKLVSQLIFLQQIKQQKNSLENELSLLDSLDKNTNLEIQNAFSLEELNQLSLTLRHLTVLGETVLRTSSHSFHEWTAWVSILTEQLAKHQIVKKFIFEAEKRAENQIPPQLKEILLNSQIKPTLKIELQEILPRFIKLLKYLKLIEEMIQKDSPLKSSLMFFAIIYEESQQTIKFLNKRLLRFHTQEGVLFETLDCAVFATSMEIRRVFNEELTDVTTIRQAPLLRARIEAAFGLLSDSFQQSIHSFTKIIQPEIEINKLFPNFQTKLQQSLVLRKDLWIVLNAVKKVEENPDAYPLNEFHQLLFNFLQHSLKFLMYKDWETVERFIEEVVRIKNKNDLTPILHRFGAYLETLFGQVNMRMVLANHPFEPPPK